MLSIFLFFYFSYKHFTLAVIPATLISYYLAHYLVVPGIVIGFS